MGCPSCGDSVRQTCGCFPGLPGRRRRPQRQVPPSTGSTQQVSESSSIAQMASPNRQATSRTGGGQQASRGDVAAQQTGRGQQASGSGLAQQQTARETVRRENLIIQRPLVRRIGPAQQQLFRSAEGGDGPTSSERSTPCEWLSTPSGRTSTSSEELRRELERASISMPRLSPLTPMWSEGPWPRPSLASCPTKILRDHEKNFIKTTFLIVPRSRTFLTDTMDNFAENFVEDHNREIPNHYPQMKRVGMPSCAIGAWNLYVELVPIIVSGREFLRFTLSSPALNVNEQSQIYPAPSASGYDGDDDNDTPIIPPPNWKKVIQATWGYLKKYTISRRDGECYTSVMTEQSIRPYNVPELRRICSAIIHFEPALSVLTEHSPESPATENWRDNPYLGKVHRTRAESIAALEEILPGHEWGVGKPLLDMIQAGRTPSGVHMPYYWHLDNWHCAPSFEGSSIQWRLLPASESVSDAIWWVDTMVSFLRQALASTSTKQLQKNAPNLEGLRDFLSGRRRPPGSELLVTRRRGPRVGG